ncbi:hypothetical protein ONZ45_g5496 [Pleurotus djamor]|nr:hypothetical protein ONZ45_g5496 [Pleurotus djamor]
MADTSRLLVTEAHLALDEARRQKADRTKTLGSPIQLPGKALFIIVKGGDAWVAENTHISGNTLQVYRGHNGPVTSIALFEDANGKYLVSGSWDKTIKIWNTSDKSLVSSTDAHSDFVKALHVIPSIQLLISAGSDKIVWELTKVDGQPTSWRASLKTELNHHRTRINELLYGNGHLWTASADETVKVTSDAIIQNSDASVDAKRKPPLPHLIEHPMAVRCMLPLSITDLGEPYILTGSGDVIRVYDISSPEEPELINEMDAHWHDVTALRLWMRRFTGDDQKERIEPWVISASLDGTIRKWQLAELMKPISSVRSESQTPKVQQNVSKDETQFQMSEEEERELAELMGE